MSDSVASANTLADRNLAIDDCASRNDITAIVQYLNDDFSYIHGSGRVQTRAEYVAEIGEAKNPQQRQLTENVVEIHGDVAVAYGNIDVTFQDNRPMLYLRYVRVWRLVGGQWLAISQRNVPASDRKPR